LLASITYRVPDSRRGSSAQENSGVAGGIGLALILGRMNLASRQGAAMKHLRTTSFRRAPQRFVSVVALVSMAAAGAAAVEPASPPEASPPSPDPTSRVLAGGGLGLLGGAAGFGIGFYGMIQLFTSGHADCITDCGDVLSGLGLLGGTVLGAVALPLGAYAGSEWVGGDGSLGWTVLGGLGGSALGALAVIASVSTDAPAPWIAASAALPPLAGAVLGYELSAASNAETRPSVSLGVAAQPGGARLGVSGTF
jgi:hypothetical protein